jgi:hypothetical protein
MIEQGAKKIQKHVRLISLVQSTPSKSGWSVISITFRRPKRCFAFVSNLDMQTEIDLHRALNKTQTVAENVDIHGKLVPFGRSEDSSTES